jgi:SAM-dependent methyltransferase
MSATSRGAELAPVPSRPCPVCGERSAAAWSSRMTGLGSDARGRALARCRACGVVFIDPVPTSALDPSTYGSAYYQPWQGREERARLLLWERRLSALRSRAGSGSLLDIGCGDGLFLKVASEAGHAVEGIEFSPEGARRAALRLGRPIAVGDLSRSGLLNGPFDIVTLWHVLEHLVDPSAMVAAAHRRLRPGGLLAVAVPNLDNVPMQVAYLAARRRPLPLYAEDAREPHLVHFDPRSLSIALERHGFADIEVQADRCALTLPKRAIDSLAACLSRISGRLMTDAIVAFARRKR